MQDVGTDKQSIHPRRSRPDHLNMMLLKRKIPSLNNGKRELYVHGMIMEFNDAMHACFSFLQTRFRRQYKRLTLKLKMREHANRLKFNITQGEY
jgi:hypothetical protein